MGLVFGFFYLAIPIFTGVVFGSPVQLLPIPFFDFTTNTEHALPTALVGYNPDLGALMTGFILPLPIVVGAVISSCIAQIGVNPVLHAHGMMPHWLAGSDAISTNISNQFDFWMSFGIGTQLAVAVIGITSVVLTLARSRRREDSARRGGLGAIPKGRGDFPWQLALGAWLLATLGYVILNHKLVPMFPIWIVAFYGLVWTPLNSYISARMIGLTGSGVTFPFLNQGVVLKSGYSQPDIWFAPLPLSDYGPQAQKFREIELTGTKFTSILWLEVTMLPLILITSFLYWGFLWHTTEIPSAQFPYAQKLWPQAAVQQAIWAQVNAKGGANWALHALKMPLIKDGFGVGLLLFGLTKLFNLPLMFFYGLIGGMGNMPHYTIPPFIGGMLGRYYFAKRFGAERWSMYTPVLIAGFACGVGLIGMAAIALALISKTVNYLPF